MAFRGNREEEVEAQFVPLTLDTAPLKTFLLALAKQVDALQRDNNMLRAELADLKIGSRLDTLEASIEELAEMQNPGTDAYTQGSGQVAASRDGRDGAGSTGRVLPEDSRQRSVAYAGQPGGGMGANAAAAAAQLSAEVSGQVVQLAERLEAIERKSEALWHQKETDSELRGMVGRLKSDVDGLRQTLTDAQSTTRSAQVVIENLQLTSAKSDDKIKDLTDRCSLLEAGQTRAEGDKRDAAVKLEGSVNQIWEQIRHVENSMSQRLTLAETSQVSTLQELDEVKETCTEVLGQVQDTRRHIAALESKLESFNTQVAAAISPLHTSLASIHQRLEEMQAAKQDIATAVSVEDVNVAVSRAIDHADRRSDNIIKSVGAMEERIEELNDIKANKSDVVMTTDLEALLTAHAAELDKHLDVLRGDIMRAVAAKADKDELVGLDTKLGQRIAVLENAILKGLKAISDKVSAALSEKLDLTRFNEFKVQVRAILADIEDRLRDFSPIARGSKAPMDGSGAVGASSCLCCDARVRSVRDLQTMGFGPTDKVFSPERLPNTEPLLPAINRSPDIASYQNAKLAGRKRDVANLLTRTTPGGLAEGLHLPAPGSPPGGPTPLLASIDASQLLQLPKEVGPPKPGAGSKGANSKVEVETISGTIAQGRIPTLHKHQQAVASTRPLPSAGKSSSPANLSPWEGPDRPDSVTSSPQLMLDNTSMGRQQQQAAAAAAAATAAAAAAEDEA